MENKPYFWIAVILVITSVIGQRDRNGNFCPSFRRPHPTNCSLFFYCVNITMPEVQYVWVPGKCNMGLVFEPTLGMCVIPASITICKESSFTKNSLPTIQNYQHQQAVEEPNLEFETPIRRNGEILDTKQILNLFNRKVSQGPNLDGKFSNNKYIQNDYQPLSFGYKVKEYEKWNNIKQIFQDMPLVAGSRFNPLSEPLKGIGTNQKEIYGNIPFPYAAYNDYYNKFQGVPSTNNYQLSRPNMESMSNSHQLDSMNEKSKTILPQSYLDKLNEYQQFFTDSFVKNNNQEINDKNDHKSADVETKVKNLNNGNREQQDTENRGNHTNSNKGKVNVKNKSNDISTTTPLTIDKFSGLPQPYILRQSSIQCKHSARQPNLKDCMKYYICNATGELVSHSCPYHTAFNAYTKKCESKIYQDCLTQMHSTTSSYTEDDYYDTIEPDNVPVTENTKPQVNQTFECSKQGKFMDITSSQNYFICSLDPITQTLTKHQLTCPNTLEFCAERKMCTFKANCT